MCVWVSGASLDSLSPGPQHRHRGRLRHVSLPPRRSQAELSHVSAKRELTLNQDVEAESIQRRVAASTRRAWSNIATQHRGCIAASPRTARGRRSRWALGPGGAGCARAGQSLPGPADGRRAGRPRGLVCSLLLDVLRRSASGRAARPVSYRYSTRGDRRRGGNDAEKKMYRPIAACQGGGRGKAKGTHTPVSHGGDGLYGKM